MGRGVAPSGVEALTALLAPYADPDPDLASVGRLVDVPAAVAPVPAWSRPGCQERCSYRRGVTAGGAGRAPRRARTGAPAGLPEQLRNAAPRDLVGTEPLPNGALPRWPEGPFLPLSRYPQLTAHVRQVASLARDAQLFREGRGWTRKKLAEVAGLNEQTYGDFEAGRTWPVPSTLYRVAEALNADLRLVGRGTQPSPERRRW